MRYFRQLTEEGREAEASTIDLDWAVDTAAQCYSGLEAWFGYLETDAPDLSLSTRRAMAVDCRTLLANLVKSIQMATLLSDQETVIESLFGDIPVGIFEEGDEDALQDLQ